MDRKMIQGLPRLNRAQGDLTLKIAMAPMEGVTTAVYRKVYQDYFEGVDVYYTPFLSLNQTHKFKKREKREVIPYRDNLIPQVLTNSVEDYCWGARELADMGYRVVNINMGCPSGTVVSKGKGAGMLKDTDRLDQFLDGIFEISEKENLPQISVKMRMGINDVSETSMLASIISQYPFCEVIVHPRLREDFYRGKIDYAGFDAICDAIRSGAYSGMTRIMYNGDLDSLEAVEQFCKKYPFIDHIMLGRGLLKHPMLAAKIKGACGSEDTKSQELYLFIRSLYEAYEEELTGERAVLFKMKDLLAFMVDDADDPKVVKAMKKAKSKTEFLCAAERWANRPIHFFASD